MFLKLFTICACICLSSLFTSQVLGKAIHPTRIEKCYGKECPEHTFACERHSSLSEDRKEVITRTSCLGLSGNSVKNYTDSRKNPLGANTYIETYSYVGGFSFGTDSFFGTDSDFPSVVYTTPRIKDREPLGNDNDVEDREPLGNNDDVEVFRK